MGENNLIKTEGDFAYYEDGSVRWAIGNSQNKQAGSLAERPEYAMEPFDSKTALEANQKRQLQNALAATRGLTNAVTQTLGKPVTESEAIEYTMEALMNAGLSNIAGARNPLAIIEFVFEKMEAFRDIRQSHQRAGDIVQITMSEDLARDLMAKRRELDGEIVNGSFRKDG